MRIGLDFDNTIICYDAVFASAAVERGLLPPGFRGAKQAVREELRRRPNGELDWQRLQGHVYGAGIGAARAFAGVRRFLLRARAAGARVLVVSHKTEYGHFDAARVNLRDAALGWMETHGLVASEGAALARADIHFAATRADKVALIGELGCDQFVDDLEEVLNDPEFPPRVRRVLFARHLVPSATPYQVCRSWREISRALLG